MRLPLDLPDDLSLAPKIVLLVFVSGKVVLTGGKVRNEIYAAFEQIYPVLQEFRKAAAPVAGALQ